MAKIIILGAGLVGSVMAKDLAKAHKVCSVDLNQKALKPLSEVGIKTLCTDISNKDTISNLKNWLNDVNKFCKNVPVSIVGNKIDKCHDLSLLKLSMT